MTRLHQVFAALESGPIRLDTSAFEQPHDFLDQLPLGVYEGVRTFEHDRFIGLDEHLVRAQLSMDRCGWGEELDCDLVRRSLQRIVTDYEAADARVRFDILARSAPELGVDSRIVFAISPFVPIASELLATGVRVRLLRELNRQQPLVKQAEFIARRRPYPIHAPESFEQIMLDDQERLLEGITSNFFYIESGVLKTSGSGVLEGVTRAFIKQLARDEGIEVVEEALRSADISAIDEAFITSSVKGIVPVRMIEEELIGSGAPGPLTKHLMRTYEAYTAKHARRAIELSTPA